MDDLERTKAVQRMQDFIEEHLGEAITLNDLSDAADRSRSHSLRMFRELTGLTPFEYIRRYRLTHGARKLRCGDIKVRDAASQCAFGTHEGFTKAFSKEFGLSPERYRENHAPVGYFIPYSVLIRYLVNSKGAMEMENKEKQTVFVHVEERPERKAVIRRGVKAENYYEYCSEVGCDVWGVLESIEGMYEPAGFWLPRKLIKKGTSKYVQGVELPPDHSGPVPDGFEMITMEPCTVMYFQGERYDDRYFEDAIRDVRSAIEKFDPSVHGFEWADDDAPSFQLMPLGSRGYIEARPVRALKKR